MNEQPRIFIVEDEPIVLAGYRSMLEKQGCIVIGDALDGKEAVAGILELKPDLVIADVNLPDTTGFAVMEEVNKTLRVPAIIITGYNNREVLEQTRESYIFGYLQKPIDEKEMSVMIQIAVQHDREISSLRTVAANLKQDLENRKIVERAKGILMDEMGMKEKQAMEFLQKRSKEKNIKLVEVAKKIIAMNAI